MSLIIVSREAPSQAACQDLPDNPQPFPHAQDQAPTLWVAGNVCCRKLSLVPILLIPEHS